MQEIMLRKSKLPINRKIVPVKYIISVSRLILLAYHAELIF